MHPIVFIEAFLSRLIPVFHEVTLGAIRQFHLEEYPLNALLAGLGGLLALALYYALGIFLRRMPERVSTPEQQARVEAMRAKAGECLPWLLVLSPTPLGGIMIMAAGFFRLSPKLALTIVIASEILFRAMPYLR